MPLGLSEFLQLCKRALAQDVEDQVVGLSVLGEVLFGVIDDLIGAQRLHVFQPRGAADPGDFCAVVLRKLDCGRADSAGRAVDQHLLAGLDFAPAQEAHRHDRAVGHGGGFCVAHVGRLHGQRAVFRHAQILGIGAHALAEVADTPGRPA